MSTISSGLLAESVVRRTSIVDGWRIEDYDQVGSTNLLASDLGAWTAVRAKTQSAGRGRFQRTWVSDLGGLWISAVVPLGADPAQNQTLPLVAGLSIINTLTELGVKGARLRWPNDVLVDGGKLAGVLVDRFSLHQAVVGIGMNVTNRPADKDPSLAATAARLADLIQPTPGLEILTATLLRNLKSSVETLAAQGFGPLSRRINDLWGGHRSVELQLDTEGHSGVFVGVDRLGRILLKDKEMKLRAFSSHEVRLLRESQATEAHEFIP